MPGGRLFAVFTVSLHEWERVRHLLLVSLNVVTFSLTGKTVKKQEGKNKKKKELPSFSEQPKFHSLSVDCGTESICFILLGK